MNSKKQFILGIFSLFTMAIFAQSYQVTGKVTDAENQPLPGVSITIEGTSRGTSTDFNGNYAVMVESSENLIFSYVGYNEKKLQMDGTKTFNVVLVSGLELKEVVVVGSRNPNRTAVDTAVPVDVIDMKEIASAGAQISVTQILNYVAPSFSSNTQTVADGTDHIDPAQLRGLGPDQVLVLINGKRRHTSSLVNVNGSPGRGAVGTDLNAIPVASIKRIEVLRDGAAAQYGSDAIAGVINIVLKDAVNELTVAVTTGANISKNANDLTGGTDGEKTQVDINYGLPLGEKGGFINLTGSLTTRERTSRAGVFSGQVFNGYNAIEWGAYNDNFDLTNLMTNVNEIKNYATQVGYFTPQLQSNIAAATTLNELRTLLNFDNTDDEIARRGQTRSDYNMSVGQSGLKQGQFMGNLSIPLENDAEIYAFGGMSYRHGDASGFYRPPGNKDGRANTLVNINGFLPNIESGIIDKSFGFGIKGKINDWNVDLSNTWGLNTFAYNITNTTNFYLQASSPSEFYAGLNGFQQNTVNLDISKFYEDTMAGLNVAFGAEYRVENFFIQAGEESSYAKYDINGEIVTSQTPEEDKVYSFIGALSGSQAAEGAQVFKGFTPENEVDARRNSYAFYTDIEADLTESFLLTGALRYEDFSDFGSTLNGKISMRLKASDNFNIRGAFSTGFRAPSLHQQYYSKSNTLFNAQGIATETGTFTNNSQAAKLFGIPKLKEETSVNGSLGFTWQIPTSNLTFTLDGFMININDRVTYTDGFSKPANDGSQQQLYDIYTNLGIGSAAFFANAIDTRTKGVDFVATHNTAFVSGLKLSNNFAFTYSRTKQEGAIKTTPLLEASGQSDKFFSEGSRIFLELAVPRVKANLSHNLASDKWSIFLRNAFFGSVVDNGVLPDGTMSEIGAVLVTDLSASYNVSKAFKFTVGANNLFDVYPDELDPSLRSSNQFVYSRRVSQFGNNGRFVFARLNIVLK